VLIDGKPSDEGRDVRRSKLPRVASAMEGDEATDPVDVGIFGPPAVVPGANRRPHLIEKMRCHHSHPPDDDAIVRPIGSIATGSAWAKSALRSLRPWKH
jgi:hypothetical protein